MSTTAGTTNRLPLAVAEQLAAKIVAELAPACDRIAVAGSVRRRADTPRGIGDIEVVCIPKLGDPCDLFGDVQGPTQLDDKINALRKAGRLSLPRRDGPRWKTLPIVTFPGINLDLFIVTPETWGWQYLLRTGPQSFTHRLVTQAKHGGLLPADTQIREGRVWKFKPGPPPHAHATGEFERIATPEERDVFDAMGLGYIEPEGR